MSFGVQSGSLIRTSRIDGTDLLDLLDELFDPTYIANTGYSIGRKRQHLQFSWLVIDDVAVESHAVDNPPASPASEDLRDYAKLQVAMTFVAVSVNGGRDPGDPNVPEGHLTHDRDASAEMITVPEHGLVWFPGNDPLGPDIDAGKVLPTITHTMNWLGCSAPPFTALSELLGTVNEIQFMGAAAMTLLYAGYGARQRVDDNGDLLYDLSITFVELAHEEAGLAAGVLAGWNHLYRPDAAVNWSLTDPYLYALSSDFANLFTLGP